MIALLVASTISCGPGLGLNVPPREALEKHCPALLRRIPANVEPRQAVGGPSGTLEWATFTSEVEHAQKTFGYSFYRAYLPSCQLLSVTASSITPDLPYLRLTVNAPEGQSFDSHQFIWQEVWSSLARLEFQNDSLLLRDEDDVAQALTGLKLLNYRRRMRGSPPDLSDVRQTFLLHLSKSDDERPALVARSSSRGSTPVPRHQGRAVNQASGLFLPPDTTDPAIYFPGTIVTRVATLGEVVVSRVTIAPLFPASPPRKGSQHALLAIDDSEAHVHWYLADGTVSQVSPRVLRIERESDGRRMSWLFDLDRNAELAVPELTVDSSRRRDVLISQATGSIFRWEPTGVTYIDVEQYLLSRGKQGVETLDDAAALRRATILSDGNGLLYTYLRATTPEQLRQRSQALGASGARLSAPVFLSLSPTNCSIIYLPEFTPTRSGPVSGRLLLLRADRELTLVAAGDFDGTEWNGTSWEALQPRIQAVYEVASECSSRLPR